MDFQPLFFPGHGGRLYGVLHYPASGQGNEQAVLIMPPLGHEYTRCHKTLQKLAVDLASAGYHVLRFDYLGTGDSSDAGEFDLEVWMLNALDALRQLSSSSGSRRLSVVGVRLGASLALCLDADLEALLLWDPIGSGEAYLRQLQQLNAELLETTQHSLRSVKTRRLPAGEMVGHKMPEAMRESLLGFQTVACMQTRAKRMVWIETGEKPPVTEPILAQRLLDMGCARYSLDMSCHWRARAELSKTLMGQPVARVILDDFSK